MSVQSKIALITGAAGGIGLGIAQRFARDGAKVVLSDILDEEGEQQAAAIRAEGGNAVYIRADTSDEADVERLVEAAEKAFDPVDIAVCSAGVAMAGKPFHETPLEDFRRVIDINLIGAFLVGKAVAARLVARGASGCIINISSVGGELAVAESPAYCVSKAALTMLTKTQALAMADHGVRVNAIGPGPVETPLTAHIQGDAKAMMLSRTPLRRFGTIEEMAGVAAFLASEDSGFITGQTIYADGGRLALNYVMAPKG